MKNNKSSGFRVDYSALLKLRSLMLDNAFLGRIGGNVGLGETIFKSLIIMKICNNDKMYNHFLPEYRRNIENAIQSGLTQYKAYYDTLIELTNYLDSGKYRELL